MTTDISIDQNEIDALLGLVPPSDMPPSPPPPQEKPRPTIHAENISFQPLSGGKTDSASSEIDLVKDIPLELSVELGRTKRSIADILDFGIGTVVELTRLAGEPVYLMANGKLIAKGEVVVIDENFAIRITDIIIQKAKQES
jgi:flagellar motor switch protein FliN/FliY